MSGRLAWIAARAGLLALSVMSGTYALLAYIPFTYQAVIKFPMVSWVPAFVRFHPFLLLALVLVNLALDRKRWMSPASIRAHSRAGMIRGSRSKGKIRSVPSVLS